MDNPGELIDVIAVEYNDRDCFALPMEYTGDFDIATLSIAMTVTGGSASSPANSCKQAVYRNMLLLRRKKFVHTDVAKSCTVHILLT